MGQRQSHRGKHPEETRLFADKWAPVLRKGVADLSFLLTRGYAMKPASALVGDHYQLAARQRLAVKRAACSDQSLQYRLEHETPVGQLSAKKIAIDGYNLLIGTESALGGGILLRGRDACIRDMASIHGSYHTVEETLPAIHLIGDMLANLAIEDAIWYLDSPVSNSGRLAQLIRDEAGNARWPWQVIVHNSPDRQLAESDAVIISSDSWVLDRSRAWANFMGHIAESLKKVAMDLGASGAD